MREMMQHVPLGVFVVMVAFPLAMTALLLFAAHRGRRTAAVVASAKSEPIGMASDGYRRFEGRAEAIGGEPLRAPLTGVACVWYEARLEQWIYSAAMKRSGWEPVRSVTSSAPLLIRDGTGACLVDTWLAEVTPTDRSRWTGATPEPVDRHPPRLGPTQSFSEGLQVSGGPNHQYRYTELRVYPGDPVLVVGLFTSGRFTAANHDEDDEDDDLPDDPSVTSDELDDETPDANLWHAYDEERESALWRLGRGLTRAHITSSGKGQPLILASATAATHVAMNEMGAQAAVYVALVPLGIAALMMLARFG